MLTLGASKPVYHSEQPFAQGELKQLFKNRNKARKLWQYTRHPQHKTDLNRLQNIIRRKVYQYRQQAWEDNISSLNAEDNSLWGIAKAFRKATPISTFEIIMRVQPPWRCCHTLAAWRQNTF
ncbi:uncharacterized protein TNCT_208091 [Trichonephila clavata]|uniref:Uncharacterized protein n=1 Tax=Trichonephila clavata TaxID=2740835 RepID=A0A8X6GRZ4_TRICU|nr:uncharacterized protein TNCT_208091 [Trichonephila clavata]